MVFTPKLIGRRMTGYYALSVTSGNGLLNGYWPGFHRNEVTTGWVWHYNNKLSGQNPGHDCWHFCDGCT